MTLMTEIPAPVRKSGPPHPDFCQHFRIDNETVSCIACGVEMVAWTLNAKTVLSAPNLNPCTNPEHLRAIANGEPVECSAQYVPGRPREVLLGYEVNYQCPRCESSGTESSICDGQPLVFDCGRTHRGLMIRSTR